MMSIALGMAAMANAVAAVAVHDRFPRVIVHIS
jgi:hypothetical protein